MASHDPAVCFCLFCPWCEARPSLRVYVALAGPVNSKASMEESPTSVHRTGRNIILCCLPYRVVVMAASHIPAEPLRAFTNVCARMKVLEFRSTAGGRKQLSCILSAAHSLKTSISQVWEQPLPNHISIETCRRIGQSIGQFPPAQHVGTVTKCYQATNITCTLCAHSHKAFKQLCPFHGLPPARMLLQWLLALCVQAFPRSVLKKGQLLQSQGRTAALCTLPGGPASRHHR